jgi:hypothetical protein
MCYAPRGEFGASVFFITTGGPLVQADKKWSFRCSWSGEKHCRLE